MRSGRVERVLMTADTVGGVWTYAMELCAALSARGLEVALATMGEPVSTAQAREAARIPRLQLHESRLKLEWMQDPWRDVDAAGEWLLGLAADLRPDVVHLNGYAHGALPWSCPVVVVAHSCVASWWEGVHGQPAPAEWDCYRARVRRGLRRADVVVAPTRAFAGDIQRLHGPLEAVEVIHNARRAELFPPLTKAQLVFAAGRVWDEAKNVQALVRVAPRLRWPVLVAGAGEHPDGGSADTGNLCFLGKLPTPELASWMGRAAIYALPARYEPFGLSVVEAALARCALVLGDLPTLRELWEGAAVFVDPRDDEALRGAIDALTRDAARCAFLGERARARALEMQPGTMAERYLRVYRRAAAPLRRTAAAATTRAQATA